MIAPTMAANALRSGRNRTIRPTTMKANTMGTPIAQGGQSSIRRRKRNSTDSLSLRFSMIDAFKAALSFLCLAFVGYYQRQYPTNAKQRKDNAALWIYAA